MQLINPNGDRIRTEFKSWTYPPATLHGDAAALARYANTLITLARVIEKHRDGNHSVR
jgi:hypothetical protein